MKINSAQFLPCFSSGELLLHLLYVSWITLIYGLTWEVSNLTVYSFVIICMTKHFVDMELKQPWRLGRRKRHLRSELALFQTSTILFHLVQFVQWWRIILVSNWKGLQCLSKLRTCLVFSSSTKREIKKPHVVIIQRRQRNVHKSEMHGYNLLFATSNLLFFLIVSVVIFVV